MTQRTTVGRFEVIFEPEEEGGYHVFCPLPRGCHSYGKTKAEARKNIAQAIELWLESAKEGSSTSSDVGRAEQRTDWRS